MAQNLPWCELKFGFCAASQLFPRFNAGFLCRLVQSRDAAKLTDMRVLGIDCGTEFTGYGCVETHPRTANLQHVAAGTIRLNKKHKTAERLAQVFAELTAADCPV